MFLILVGLEGSLYPIPDYPANILPYVFLVMLGTGIGHFMILKKTDPKRMQELEKALLDA